MSNPEAIEKVRQEIMRFRELLDILREKLDDGERIYEKLFSSLSPEEAALTKEKDRQWKLAEKMVADLSPLSRAVFQMYYEAREMERAFEELHNIIVTVPDDDAQ